LVEAPVYDSFVERFVAAVQAAKIGDPLQPDVMLGPVITEAAANRILVRSSNRRSPSKPVN
jgi:aldehyde dehydrogenase (NAD+)